MNSSSNVSGDMTPPPNVSGAGITHSGEVRSPSRTGTPVEIDTSTISQEIISGMAHPGNSESIEGHTLDPKDGNSSSANQTITTLQANVNMPDEAREEPTSSSSEALAVPNPPVVSTPIPPLAVPLAPTLTVNPGTTLAELQTHADTISLEASGKSTQGILLEMKRHLETRFPGQPVTVTSNLERDVNRQNKLEIFDHHGRKCFKIDVTYKLANASGEEIEVKQTIYTNAVDPKKALQIAETYNETVINSQLPENERILKFEFDKDRKGQFTELKSVMAGTTPIATPWKDTEAYRSKFETLKSASYSTVGGHEVLLNQLEAKDLTFEKFLSNIEQKKKECEKTEKNSFLRFNGVFGRHESSDVATYAAFNDAYEAVQASIRNGGSAQVNSNRWEAVPKVKAYVDAYNTAVRATQEGPRQIQAAEANVQRFETELTTLRERLPVTRSTLNDLEPAFTQAQTELSDAHAREISADRALASLVRTIYDQNDYDQALSEVQDAERDVENKENQFYQIQAEYNQRGAVVDQLEREIHSKETQRQQASDSLPTLQGQVQAQSQSAISQFQERQQRFGELHQKMTARLDRFRTEHNELGDMKRAVDELIANPTIGGNPLSQVEIDKLQEISDNLQATLTSNEALIARLGLRQPVPVEAEGDALVSNQSLP